LDIISEGYSLPYIICSEFDVLCAHYFEKNKKKLIFVSSILHFRFA